MERGAVRHASIPDYAKPRRQGNPLGRRALRSRGLQPHALSPLVDGLSNFVLVMILQRRFRLGRSKHSVGMHGPRGETSRRSNRVQPRRGEHGLPARRGIATPGNCPIARRPGGNPPAVCGIPQASRQGHMPALYYTPDRRGDAGTHRKWQAVFAGKRCRLGRFCGIGSDQPYATRSTADFVRTGPPRRRPSSGLDG